MPEPELTVSDRLAAREAYRDAWRRRLDAVLTADWQSSADLASALRETNAKVLERLGDMVKDGSFARIVVRRPGVRAAMKQFSPFVAYFRFAIGPAPQAPTLSAPPFQENSGVRNPLARPLSASPVPPRRFDVSAVSDAIAAVAMDLSPTERRLVAETYGAGRGIPFGVDRRLLSGCSAKLRRTLDPVEKPLIRKGLATLCGYSPPQRTAF